MSQVPPRHLVPYHPEDKMANPLRIIIEVDLLLFRDGIRRIDNSLRAGHITVERAHQQKNRLAGIYAERIVQLIDERRSETNG